MQNINIHNPCNEITRYYRNYNLFWDQLTYELKKKYKTIENRYFSEAHKKKFEVKSNFFTSNDFLELSECEYLIENLDTEEFFILSVSDDLTSAILNERSNPRLKKVLVSQFIDYKIKHHVKDYYYKYFPWIYFPSSVINLDQFYYKRLYKKELIKKLFFKGAQSNRPILNFFNNEFFSTGKLVDQYSYYDEMSNHIVALSIAGVGELCYRDIECMAIGVPLIRFEYQSEFYNPLIPNYHYISIPYDKTIPKHNDVYTDRLGLKEHAEKIMDRFFEVMNNSEFLTFISENARRYYLENLSDKSRLELTLKILEL